MCVDCVIEKINTKFKQRNLYNSNDFGVFNGLSGELLFLLMYKFLTKDETNKSLIYLYYDRIYEVIENSSSLYVNWASGISGYFYMLNYLHDHNIISDEDYEYDSSFDEIIYLKILEFINVKNYDCLYGVGGLLYFLQSRTNKNNVILDYLVDVIDEIYANKYIYMVDQKNVDLGIPHGISGWILILCEIYYKLDKNEKVFEILNKLSLILLGCLKYNDKGNSSLFPKYNTGGSYNGYSLGWCYGDFSCCLALLKSKSILNLEEYRLFEILKLITCRKKSMLDNIGICHGAAGLMIINRYLYDKIKYIEFRESEYFWKSNVIEKLNHLMNKDDFSLINGLSGLGLALLIGEYSEMTILNKILFL